MSALNIVASIVNLIKPQKTFYRTLILFLPTSGHLSKASALREKADRR